MRCGIVVVLAARFETLDKDLRHPFAVECREDELAAQVSGTKAPEGGVFACGGVV